MVISIAWALAPLLILALQFNLDLDYVTGWVIDLVRICLVLSSLIFLIVALQLRRIRRFNVSVEVSCQ
jgi:hypothetical protein